MSAKFLPVRGQRVAVTAPQVEEAVESVERPKGLAPCLTYLFIEFARPMDWLPFLRLIKPGMLVAFWGLGTVLLKRERPIPRPLWYMFGLLAVMAWNVPWAVNNRWAFWGFQDFGILVLGCVLPIAVLPRNLAAVRYLLTAYVLFHVPMAIHGLFNRGFGLYGWMGDENDLALALNAALGAALYLLFETRDKRKKILLAVVMGILVAGVVATLSRGGFVGLAALGLFLLLVGPFRGRILATILVAVVGLYLFAPEQYWNEVQSIQTAGQKGDTGEARLYFWGIGWRMYLDHPIFGVGTRNYGIRAPEYESWERAEVEGQHIWGRVAHSLYFTLLPEQGTVGAVLFLLIVVWSLRTWWRLRSEGEHHTDDDTRSAALLACGMVAAIFAVLVTGAFISVLYYPILWIITGMLGALDGVTRRRAVQGAT